MIPDVELDAARTAMLNAYEHACSLQAELLTLPRWHWNRRHRLNIALNDACDLADEHRRQLGARDGRPMRAILDDLVKAERAR